MVSLRISTTSTRVPLNSNPKLLRTCSQGLVDADEVSLAVGDFPGELVDAIVCFQRSGILQCDFQRHVVVIIVGVPRVAFLRGRQSR